MRAVPPDEVVAIVNTGDDDEFHGLHVSPDLDSVTYTLAGASNAAQGWGLEGETFATLDALARYDVRPGSGSATRTSRPTSSAPQRLRAGRAALGGDRRDRRGVGARPPAAADDRRPRCAPASRCTRDDGRHRGARDAGVVRRRAGRVAGRRRFASTAPITPGPRPGVLEALRTADTIVICPSNPVISIGPILAVPGIRDVLVGAARAGRRDQPDRRRRAR